MRAYSLEHKQCHNIVIGCGQSLTSLRLRVVSHTKERIYYHLPEKKKGEERKTREKGERRKEKGERSKECPIEAILNNHSLKLF